MGAVRIAGKKCHIPELSGLVGGGCEAEEAHSSCCGKRGMIGLVGNGQGDFIAVCGIVGSHVEEQLTPDESGLIWQIQEKGRLAAEKGCAIHPVARRGAPGIRGGEIVVGESTGAIGVSHGGNGVVRSGEKVADLIDTCGL